VDVTYELAAEPGRLVMTSLRGSPLTLTPADEGRFDGPSLRLTLVRGADGAVTGFTVATGRTRDVVFGRVGPHA
jgi:hypothetical protein